MSGLTGGSLNCDWTEATQLTAEVEAIGQHPEMFAMGVFFLGIFKKRSDPERAVQNNSQELLYTQQQQKFGYKNVQTKGDFSFEEQRQKTENQMMCKIY